jgi:hypothetical protein
VTTPDPRPRRRRVITWTALGIVAVIAAVAAYWALARSGTVAAPPPISTSSTPPQVSLSDTAAPSGSSAAAAGAAARTANGCLGGQDPFQAVLAAQQAATPDQIGAAEFALTFARWTVTYPIDPNASAVLSQVAAPGYQPAALAALNQYASTLTAGGYTSAGTTPGGADQYRIRGTNRDQTSVTIDMIVYRQATKATGAVETVQGYTTLVLDLTDGRWQIVGSLPAIGSDPTAPRADAPWVPYVETC